MKRIILTFALSMALVTPPARAQKQPEPQVFTCIVTIIALGVFAACAVACYWNGMNSGDYSGPTNSPPILPPDGPEIPTPPDTNSVPTNIPPDITLDATRQTQHLDAKPYGWLDSSSNLVTDVYRLTIQSAPSPAGPWTNAYVVTLWESAYGDTMVVDGLWTNFTKRSPNGSITNYAPLELAHSEPQKFWRAKP